MTIDDDIPVHVAESILRDEPLRPVLPEVSAAQRAGALIGKHMQTPYLTGDFFAAIGGKVIANRAALRSIFAEVDSDPRRLGESGTQLRQQRTATLSDEDAVLERLHHLKSEETYLNACLTAMGSVYAPKLRDVDERGADEDDRRVSDEVAAEKASADAPRVA